MVPPKNMTLLNMPNLVRPALFPEAAIIVSPSTIRSSFIASKIGMQQNEL